MSERPDFAASAKFPEVNNTFVYNFGAETLDDASRLIDGCMVRDLPPDPPVVWGGAFNYCIADPTQAPPGQYTLLTWAMVPYDIRPLGGPEKWDDIRESYADKVEDVLVQYLPNLKTAKTRPLRQHAPRLRAPQSALRRQHAPERLGERGADVELETLRRLRRAEDADRQLLHLPVHGRGELHQPRRRLRGGLRGDRRPRASRVRNGGTATPSTARPNCCDARASPRASPSIEQAKTHPQHRLAGETGWPKASAATSSWSAPVTTA